MEYRVSFVRVALCLTLAILIVTSLPAGQKAEVAPEPELVRYGGMHETIGQKQHQGRVALVEVLEGPAFYGVGAVEGLRGEITIVNSSAVVTSVGSDGSLEPQSPDTLQATMLVGQSVPSWRSVTLKEAVSAEHLDETVAASAADAGLDPEGPFMFVIEGSLTDLRLHVIAGACPVHARMKAIQLPEGERPFELEAAAMDGTVVGVYAKGSVGQLTHPATSTHGHLIYKDPATGRKVTGHLERFGLASGAVLKFPATVQR
jgi:hypothetical protein